MEFEQCPSSLKQLHKYVACLCLLTIGCQQKGYDQQRTLSKFEPTDDESAFPKKHDFLKRSVVSVGSGKFGQNNQSEKMTPSRLAKRKISTQMNLDLNSTTTVQELKNFYD